MSSLGVDFGTATTAFALSVGGRTEFVRDAQGHEVHPSVLAFAPNNRVYTGYGARARLMMDPGNTLHSFKRILGKASSSLVVEQFRRQYPSLALQTGTDRMPQFHTRVGQLTATQAVSYYLSTFRELDPLKGVRPDSTTLSIPVTFDNEQRQALVGAAEAAGFANVGLIEEPYAAALAHVSQAGLAATERIALVYDLGGGTFDVALIAYQGRSMRVLGLGGDSYLGGDDIDQRVAAWATQSILEKFHWDVGASDTAPLALRLACERAKMRLSEVEETKLDLGQIDPVLAGKDLSIARAQFEKLFSDLVRRTFIVCDEVLASAGIAHNRIDALVLSGGCCHIPAIRRGVEHYVGKPNEASMAPDRLCAVGTLLHAAKREPTYVFAPIPQTLAS